MSPAFRTNELKISSISQALMSVKLMKEFHPLLRPSLSFSNSLSFCCFCMTTFSDCALGRISPLLAVIGCWPGLMRSPPLMKTLSCKWDYMKRRTFSIASKQSLGSILQQARPSFYWSEVKHEFCEGKMEPVIFKAVSQTAEWNNLFFLDKENLLGKSGE